MWEKVWGFFIFLNKMQNATCAIFIKQGFSAQNVHFHDIPLTMTWITSKHWKMVSLYMYFSCAGPIYFDCSWGFIRLSSRTRQVLQQKAVVKLASVGPHRDIKQAKWSDIIFPKGSWQLLCFKRMCPVWLAVSHIPPNTPSYRVTAHTTHCVTWEELVFQIHFHSKYVN